MLNRKNRGAAFLIAGLYLSCAQAQMPESVVNDATSYTDKVLVKIPEPALLGGFGAFDTPVDKNAVNFPNLNQKGSLGKLGVSAMDKCKTYVPTGNVAQDQECAGVNYMANNCLQTSSTQNQIITGVPNVPTGSANCAGTYGGSAGVFELSPKDKAMISNFGKAVDTTSAALSLCTETEKIIKPATTEIFNCVKNTQYNEVSCTQDLTPECSLQGGDLASSSVNKGSLNAAYIKPTAVPGVYNYLLSGGFCGGQASGSISFEVQNIAWGATITLTVSGLDDAAAVGVNKTAVYAGYPNAGPQYYGNSLPNDRTDFQIGYTWTETSEQCIAYDDNGLCTATVPSTQTLTASTKILDYCPAGYQPTFGNPSGFFCNSQGKFLMNRHEGKGTWSGTIPSSEWPLKSGVNTIELYWGTAPSGKACGSVTVQGTIVNKVPACSKAWVDNCTPYEESSGALLGNPE